jgi:amino acid transporter
MDNYLLFSIFFSAAFPSVPAYAWVLSLLIIVTVINVVGVKMAPKANAVPPCFS